MTARRTIAAAAALLFSFILPLGATPEFRPVYNSAFNFTVRVPAAWSCTEYDLGYRYIVICTKGHDAEIVVSATESTLNTVEKWSNWEEWYTLGKGFTIRSIVESKTMDLGNNMAAKMILFEHQEKGVPILERVLIAKSATSIITIECSAPVGKYGSYAELFTTVMGSLYRLDSKKK